MVEQAPRQVLFSAAVRYHLSGEFATAESLYRQLLLSNPDDPTTRHYLGFLLQQTDRLPEAREQLSAAIARDGGHAEWHFNLGIVLSRQGDIEAAIAAFTRAISLDNSKYFYWTNLGSAFEQAGEFEHAQQCYDMAMRLDPQCADAFFLMSNLCLKTERYPEARHYNYRGIAAAPGEGTSRILLGQAYHELGRPEEAVALFEQWLTAEPEHPVASHFLAAYRGEGGPERCSPAYVEATFDDFASSFDDTLQRLEYAGPRLVADYLAGQQPLPNDLAVLDLGCGTGLVGEALRPYASLLVGVDLSRAMLAHAREREVYDHLEKAEIADYLARHQQQYDLICCMDTFIYLGRLDDVLPLLHRCLKPGGHLLFSTEVLADEASDDYRLNVSGRYSHRATALQRQLLAADLQLLLCQEATIRKEAGCALAGQFYVICRPS